MRRAGGSGCVFKRLCVSLFIYFCFFDNINRNPQRGGAGNDTASQCSILSPMSASQRSRRRRGRGLRCRQAPRVPCVPARSRQRPSPRPARLREAGFERLLSSQTRGGARGPRREHEEQAMPLSRVPQGPGTFASMLNHIKQKLLTPHEPPTGFC